MNPQPLNIAEIGGGAIPELFSHEMKRVLANIADVNCDPRKERNITIKISFLPSQDRVGLGIGIAVSSKLVSTNGAKASAFLGHDENHQLMAYTVDPGQGTLAFPRPGEATQEHLSGEIVTTTEEEEEIA